MDWSYIATTVIYMILMFIIWTFVLDAVRSLDLGFWQRMVVYIAVVMLFIYFQTNILKSNTIAIMF